MLHFHPIHKGTPREILLPNFEVFNDIHPSNIMIRATDINNNFYTTNYHGRLFFTHTTTISSKQHSTPPTTSKPIGIFCSVLHSAPCTLMLLLSNHHALIKKTERLSKKGKKKDLYYNKRNKKKDKQQDNYRCKHSTGQCGNHHLLSVSVH